MKRSKGSILVMALLATVALLVLGLGLMSAQAGRYRKALQIEQATQAYALARAGLEDARVKLEMDLEFPPPGADDQNLFRYGENFGNGAYFVEVDARFDNPPYRVIKITSIGVVGNSESPAARRELIMELDSSPDSRSGPGPNPDLFRVLYVFRSRLPLELSDHRIKR